MADRKISDLTALTAPASGDYLPIVDISEAAAANKNKRITIEELFRGIPLGTAAAPSIAIEGDENTGIYSPGADQVAISTNGSGRLFVDASGNILITSGSSWATSNGDFQLAFASNEAFATTYYDDHSITVGAGTTYKNKIRVSGTGANNNITFHVGASSPNERMRLDSSGRLGLGTSSPVDTLHVVGAARFGDGTNFAGVSASSSGTSFEAAAGSANVLFKTGGTTRVLIDSSGRVGIGTTSPSALLHLATSSSGECFRAANGSDSARLHFYTASAGAQLQSQNSNLLLNAYDNYSLVLATNNNERARIDTSGRLLVGTSTSLNSDAPLQAYKASGNTYLWVQSDNLGNDNFVRGVFVSGGRSGQVGAYKHSGISNPAGFIYTQQEDGGDTWLWTDNTDQFRLSSNPAHIGTTSGTVVGTQTSDERIKNILGPVTYGLDEIKQLDPVSYALKSDPEQVPHLGFVAQQVLPLVPESVFDTNEHIEGEPEDAPTKLGMEYVALIPVLVNAVKELSAEVDSLKAQLQAS